MAASDTAPQPAQQAPAKPQEFNPRWKGYVYMLLLSLVNFASVSNLDLGDDSRYHGTRQWSLTFGISTFIITIAILVLDRCQYCCTNKNGESVLSEKFSYTKSFDGRVEGYTLLILTIWWIIGVAQMSQVGGIAYVASNILFSAWLTLFACVYTLDQWSAAKDILSIEELTGLSATLKSWYVLFLASLVTMGTSCDLHIHISDIYKSPATYGIILGLISSMISFLFILVHYRLIDYDFLHVGGWIELSASFFMILVWVIGVSILTAEGGIAATIGGSGCTSETSQLQQDAIVNSGKVCYVVWVPPNSDGTDVFSSSDSEQDGSNNEEGAIANISQVPTVAGTQQPTSPSLVAPGTSSPLIGTRPPTSTEEASAPPTIETEPLSNGTNVTASGLLFPTQAPANITVTNLTTPNATSPTQSSVTTNVTPPEVLSPTQTPVNRPPTNATDLLPTQASNNTTSSQAQSPTQMSVSPPTKSPTNALTTGQPVAVMVVAPESTSPNETESTSTPPKASTPPSVSNGSTVTPTEGFTSEPPSTPLLINSNADSVGDGIDSTNTDARDNNNETSRWLQETPSNATNQTIAPTFSPSIKPSFIPSIPPSLPPSLPPSFPPSFPPTSALLEVFDTRISCQDIIDNIIPGSNLYLAVWICFFASFNVTLRWKAAQAIKFAEAQNRKARSALEKEGQNESGRDDEDQDKDDNDDDDDDDLGNPDDDL